MKLGKILNQYTTVLRDTPSVVMVRVHAHFEHRRSCVQYLHRFMGGKPLAN